ncbi:MAG TPA: thioredoxin [Anaerolineae bacterium]|nr:thioredoxin [Anaerolineae bacterium]MCB0182065.1 thioredoxin [Anaerolineae bacterium]MCB0222726.1 thioredoxin [Anaerolineae bacterium]HRV96000.1 thioredoxin [Anaerolineae bacterium]
MASLLELTDNSFDAQVLKSDILVIADFWAEWCIPCQALDPVLEEIANRYPGQVKTVKVNIDECPAATSNYEVLNLPTLILFHNGVVVERMDGDQAKSTLKDRVNFYLHEFAR